MIILIGGTSGTGKTTVARHLATRLNAQALDVDAYRARLASHAAHGTLPGLREKVELGEEVLDLPRPRQLELKLRMARDVCNSLEDRIRDVLDRNTTLVVEGDDILPEFADRLPRGPLRAIFILPRSEREVARRETVGHPALEAMHPDHRRSRAQVTWSYAEWLRVEATRRGFSVVEAAPSEAVIRRAERALGLHHC